MFIEQMLRCSFCFWGLVLVMVHSVEYLLLFLLQHTADPVSCLMVPVFFINKNIGK